MSELGKLNGNLESRMDGLKAATEDQEARLRKIENLKWWLLGAIAVITFLAQFANSMDIPAFIG